MPNEEQSLPPEASFNPEAVAAALEDPEPNWFQGLAPEERKLAAKILPLVAGEANALAQAGAESKLAIALKKQSDEFAKAAQEALEREKEKIREANKPPDPKELEKLLTQEYIEFPVTIRERGGKGNEKQFVIRELTQAQEKKLISVVQRTLVPRLREIQQIDWTTANTMAERLQRVIDAVPEALDMLAECCAVCLDPYGEEGITQTWIQANLSSNRIVHIISAQVVAARFRDFFLAVSRIVSNGMTG